MVQFEINLFDMVFPGVIKVLRFTPTLVGSRATGHHTQNSDWDYLCVDSDKDILITYLKGNEILYTENHQNGNIKIVVDIIGFGSQILNVCFVTNYTTYSAWIKATDIMKFLPQQCNIAKRYRIEMFCNIVKYFGGEAMNMMTSENSES
jgi:hypothetical protein